jgi:hypothetical protein
MNAEQIADLLIFSFICVVGVVILIPVMVIGMRMTKAASRRSQNSADGVVASWENARITTTELIDGYRPNAARHPLAGLVAQASMSGGIEDTVLMSADGVVHANSRRNTSRMHVTIRGPHTALVYTAKLRWANVLGVRTFVDQLNAASRQLQGAAPTSGASATQSTPAGWYPDPSGTPGQRYWDGQQWYATQITAASQVQGAVPTSGTSATQSTPAGWYPD